MPPSGTYNIDRSVLFGETSAAVERIDPNFFQGSLAEEHVARYIWASRWCSGCRVLDVACGTGYGAQLIAPSSPRSIVGVDLSQLALDFGKSRYGIQAVRADALELPFKSESFDVVVSLETVEHVPNAHQFVLEIHRVLDRGGIFVLSTPNAELSSGANPYHLRELTLQEAVDLLSQCGFRDVTLAGQHWVIRGDVFRTVPGLRRLRWEIEKHPGILSLPLSVARPRVLCLVGHT